MDLQDGQPRVLSQQSCLLDGFVMHWSSISGICQVTLKMSQEKKNHMRKKVPQAKNPKILDQLVSFVVYVVDFESLNLKSFS